MSEKNNKEEIQEEIDQEIKEIEETEDLDEEESDC